MKIGQIQLIEDYKLAHNDARKVLDHWRKLVELAKWKTPQDVKNAIPSADFLSNNRIIFNIGGNKHRLLAMAYFQDDRMIVMWIGTHAEYSKKTF